MREMSNKTINVGNLHIKADLHVRIQNSSEICPLLIFYAIINTNSKILLRRGEKETFEHCWWEHRLIKPLWKIVWRFLKKLKIELPILAIPLLGIHLKKMRTLIQKDTCNSMLITLFKQPRHGNNPSIHQAVNGKGDMAYYIQGKVLSHKK